MATLCVIFFESYVATTLIKHINWIEYFVTLVQIKLNGLNQLQKYLLI